MRPGIFQRVCTPDPRAVLFILLFSVAGLLPEAVSGQALQLAEVHAGDDYSQAIQDSRTLILEIMEEAGIPGASVAVGIGWAAR